MFLRQNVYQNIDLTVCKVFYSILGVIFFAFYDKTFLDLFRLVRVRGQEEDEDGSLFSRREKGEFNL